MTVIQCSTCFSIFEDQYNYGTTLVQEDDIPQDVELSSLLSLCNPCLKHVLGIA